MYKDKNMVKKSSKGCLGSLRTFIGILFVVVLGLYVYYKWFWQEWPPARIERITGVKVPKYDVVDTIQGRRYFNRDYVDTLVVEFKTDLSDDSFDKIERMIASGNTKWKREGDRYTLSTLWGNGFPAPKGENDNADVIFGISITRGIKKGKIVTGIW